MGKCGGDCRAEAFAEFEGGCADGEELSRARCGAVKLKGEGEKLGRAKMMCGGSVGG
jgi:hypothetical protein